MSFDKIMLLHLYRVWRKNRKKFVNSFHLAGYKRLKEILSKKGVDADKMLCDERDFLDDMGVL